MKSTQTSSSNAVVVFGASSPGIYYFISQKHVANASNCNTANTQNLGTVSSTGWPAG